MPDISADALQTELTRLLRLLSDARAAGDVTLTQLATAEAAKCLVKLGEAAQSELRMQPLIGQNQQVGMDTQADTDKGDHE
jgi:hypothetical protein